MHRNNTVKTYINSLTAVVFHSARPTRLAKISDQNVYKDPKYYVKVSAHLLS